MIKLIWNTMEDLVKYDQAYLRVNASCWYIWSSFFENQKKILISMMKLIWNAMQVLGIYDLAYLRHEICWYIWLEIQCKLLIYMINLISDFMQVVDTYEKAYLTLNASCWSISQSLYETQRNLLKDMNWDSMEVVDIDDQACFRLYSNSWFIW